MKNKYSVILGNLGNTCDRFCKSYKDNPSTLEMLSQAVKIPHSAYRSSRTFSATRHTGKAR